MNRPNKRGSYIVEAAVVMPIFVIAMVLLIGVIPVISKSGEVLFGVADEMRFSAARKAFIDGDVGTASLVRSRALSAGRIKSVSIQEMRSGYQESGIDDLITVTYKATYENSIAFLPVGNIYITGTVTGRAFTGSTYKKSSLSGDEDDTIVYIFPEDGKRYHKAGCRYLTAHYRQGFLSQELKGKFHACPLCAAKGAGLGQTVYYFDSYGEAYHTGDCRSVAKEKYYMECTRSAAQHSGYTPCRICGG